MRSVRHITALTLVALTTSCGTGSSSLNGADVEFLQGMIPHHVQAVDMAELVEPATERPELRELADAIISTQSEEIRLMTDLLEEAGEDVPDTGMADMDHGDGAMMGGMMPDDQMAAMAVLTGVEFDIMFAESMVAHHHGAVDAAQAVLEDGTSEGVRQLAEEVVEAQTAEIQQLTTWILEWE